MGYQKNNIKVSIMQPCFLPWAGYFYLIKKSDYFIFLTEVKIEKNSWQNKNRILSKNKILNLTVPISGSRIQQIHNAKIEKKSNWQKKISLSLYQNYKNHKFGNEILDIIIPILEDNKVEYLADFNIKIIKKISTKLDIKTKFVIDKENNFSGKKSVKLKNICQFYKSNTYLSPLGSRNYIENENIMKINKINVKYLRNLTNETYMQLNNPNFKDSMSIVDVIANIGFKESINWIEKKFELYE